MPEFASEGFDLDALQSGEDNAVLELGGKISRTSLEHESGGEKQQPDPLSEAESHKQTGNQHFQSKEWKLAHDAYTRAIEATPGIKGTEILELQRAFKEEQTRKMRETAMNSARESSKSETREAPQPVEPFVPPKHPHGKQLAVYHCNRAASFLQMVAESDYVPPSPKSVFDDKDDEGRPPPHPDLEAAVTDCSIAILLNKDYTKAWMRRCTAHERLGDTEAALADSKAALQLDPHNASLQSTTRRLQRLEDERLEQLKTETMGKLKDLGNSILGNFGLSMDNFNAVQDPNTGSYSISFNQGS